MKIKNKLFLILFSFSLLLVIALASLMQWSIGKGMVEYLNTKENESLKPLTVALANEYQQHNNWSTLQRNSRKFSDLVHLKLKGSGFLLPLPEFRHPPIGLMPAPADFKEPAADFDLFAAENQQPVSEQPPWYGLLDKNEHLVVGLYDQEKEYNKLAIMVNKQAVGYLLVPEKNQVINGYELAFIEQQHSYLWIIALLTMVLVTLVTLPLARHVVGPIYQITQGMHQLTQGKYRQQIALHRKDEIGELIRDFNELALTLDENESARKRWLANISHELRTPVAILRGELEAMIDNVRPLNKENIESTNEEVKHLQYLIDDLHQLTSADIGGMHYRKKNTDLMSWLDSEINKYRGYLADAGIRLDVIIDEKEAIVFADCGRLCQLFENLLNNCVKYSHANVVQISTEIVHTNTPPLLLIKVEDDGVGVPEQHQVNLFEYLYRVDDSRNRKTGGSGLGLSICAHIVAAHQGKISAARSDLGGLAIIIELPMLHG